MSCRNILVWLPSPMGDAVMATPALAAVRNLFAEDKITFCSNTTVAELLCGCPFADEWLILKSHSPFAIAAELKKHKFDTAILFKNSLASALVVFIARIKTRAGYARDGRGIFLTDKITPERTCLLKYKALSAVDYYLALAAHIGAETEKRKMSLEVGEEDKRAVLEKFGSYLLGQKPVVILVPGGAFGPSKLWSAERFAKVADFLVEKFAANVFISVSPNEKEIQIAEKICSEAKHPLVNLAENSVTLRQLKALFSFANLVITNDTGPRHITIALGRKVITLFGPNNPAWTANDYTDEIKIIADVPCSPCDKPVCKKDRHYCMESITVETVCRAVEKIFANEMPGDDFVEIASGFYIRSNFVDCFTRLGLKNIDDVFAFNAGENLTKNELADFRQRIRFETDNPKAVLFLKRYQNVPKLIQLKNWLARHKRVSTMDCDLAPANALQKLGINTPRTIAFGRHWQGLFEKRSFVITKKIPDATSLEQKIPACFFANRRVFAENLAAFVRKFHETGYRHRDLYLCHIFCNPQCRFTLIDLNRVFKPAFFSQRYRIKDLSQLYYSAPSKIFTKTDRLRFFLAYLQKDKLSKEDKILIKRVKSKTQRMAKHDKRHGRMVPFEY
ncbi:MAG: lipopolysaccharide heptosyltransferase II [Planctomycetes bacterium RBG_13_44_8b]|nr:MAG: lipopolysaccharide heptosyltransferase II [Planctomycetes bacterium RBG_13_44_8b]